MLSVIFDMDGTLLDTQKICIPAWEWAGLNQGIKGVGNDIQYVCGMNKAGWTAYLKQHYPTLDTDKFNREMRQYIIDNMVVRYKEGAEDLLNFLTDKGVKIALASGSSHESIDHHLKEVDGEKYFDVIVGGADVDRCKPAPDIFLLAAQRLGVAPEDCIVFEDSENGVRAAYKAGMRCIGIPDVAPFSDGVKELLFAELNNFNEAVELLRKEI